MAAILIGAVLLGLGVYAAGIAPGTTYLLALALLTGLLILQLRNGRSQRPQTPLSGMLVVGFLLYLLVQPLPLPGWMSTGYRRTVQHEVAMDHLQQAREVGLIKEAPSGSQSLSRNRAGSWRMLILVISYLAAFGVARRMSVKERRGFIVFLVGFGAVFALAGLVSKWWIPQGEQLWWFYPAGSTRSIGSFLNRTHFGGFLAMLCPLALILCIQSQEDRKPLQVVLWVTCYIALCAGVVGSLSRGGFLAMLGGMVVTGMLVFSRHHPRRSLAILCLLGLVLIGLAVLPGEAIHSRLSTLPNVLHEDSGEARLTFWSEGLTVWQDYPWLGVGPEGFRAVYAGYRSGTMSHMVTHAENEYVQGLADLGLIGCILVVLLAAAFVRRAWQDRKVPGYLPHVRAGLVGGLVAACLHNGVDFPIRAPLYGVLLFVLAGLLIAPPPAVSGESCKWFGAPLLRPLGSLAQVVLVVLVMVAYGGRIYRADASYALAEASPEELAEALVWAPTHPQIWHLLALHASEQGGTRMDVWAEHALSTASRYNPRDYRVWMDLASVRTRLNDQPGTLQAANALTALRPHFSVRLGME